MDFTNQNLKQVVAAFLVARRGDAPRWNVAALSQAIGIPYGTLHYWLARPKAMMGFEHFGRLLAWLERQGLVSGQFALTTAAADLVAKFGGARNE